MKVRVREDGAGGRECEVVRGERKGLCALDEISEQPPLSGWMGRAVLFFALCVGSLIGSQPDQRVVRVYSNAGPTSEAEGVASTSHR